MRGSRRTATHRGSAMKRRLQDSVVRSTDLVPGRERLLNNLELMVHSGFEFEDHTAVAEGFRFENYVPLTTFGDRVARVQFLDRHRLRSSVFLHPNTVGQFHG